MAAATARIPALFNIVPSLRSLFGRRIRLKQKATAVHERATSQPASASAA
jgi:hypothetical protein